MSEPRVRTRRGVLAPTLFALVGIAILCGLGLWQLERKAWKENLIATLNTRLARAPENLPPSANWSQLKPEGNEYTRVVFPAEFLAGQEALVYTPGSPLRPDVKGPGYWVFAPAQLSGGGIVLVDRGFVPLERKDPATRAGGAPRGIIEIVGVMRWPETRGLFTPADDAAGNVWYVRDTKAIAAAKKWATAAPFYIDQESPVPEGGWPKPGKLAIALPNNHWQYAITWFGLALALAGVYGVWLVGRLRRRG
ncbi:MAG: SURF1 family protein [Rhizobiales bacterium]|nr:SURF1 family protein [Hyphomicrobiales bacterium]